MKNALGLFVFRDGCWMNKYGQRIDADSTERMQNLIPLVGVYEAVRLSNPVRSHNQ